MSLEKGTDFRGRNHFTESENLTNFAGKKEQKKGFFSKKSFPIRRQVFFIFWNNKRPLSIRDVYHLVKDSRRYVNYPSIQSAINYFKSMGMLGSKERGIYFVKDWDLAKSYLEYEVEGRSLGV